MTPLGTFTSRPLSDLPDIPNADGHRKPGAYIIDQYGRVITMGDRTRHVIKARATRPRNHRTGHIKF